MISAIVFLPLIGFLVAGFIALVGRRLLLEAEPVPAGHGHGHDHHGGHAPAPAAHHEPGASRA